MIGKKTQLVVAAMNISLMIANHTFMTAIFLVLLFLRQAQSYRIALIILTHKGEQLEKIFDSHAFNCFALVEKFVTLGRQKAGSCTLVSCEVATITISQK